MTLLDWLDRLIAFDTTSRVSNMNLINFVHDWMKRHGAVCSIIRDPNEAKANLFATLPANNGRKDGGLILSGHTDVVPVDNQAWDTPPFKMVQKGDQIFGRGTSDMKGFLAVMLTLVPRFKTMSLEYPLHFALSYDEEIGCRGAPFMIAELPKTGYRPRACIVGEPTEMLPIVAHKGKQSFRCEVHGRAAHSSLTTQGCNAIEYAARLICYLQQIAEEYRQSGPFDQAYDVPHTTLATTMIKGGIASNIIPEHCEFTFEYRHIAENTQAEIEEKIIRFIDQDLLPRMRQDDSEAAITLDKFAGAPGLSHVEDTEIVKLVRTVTGNDEIHKAAYATEAGLFQQADIPTILCGPGSINQAHRPNEFITMEQLEKCERFLVETVRNFNVVSI
jgi:acetylornithine deacetylase